MTKKQRNFIEKYSHSGVNYIYASTRHLIRHMSRTTARRRALEAKAISAEEENAAKSGRSRATKNGEGMRHSAIQVSTMRAHAT